MKQNDFLKLSPAQAVKFALKKLYKKEWTIDQYKSALKHHQNQKKDLIKEAEEVFPQDVI